MENKFFIFWVKMSRKMVSFSAQTVPIEEMSRPMRSRQNYYTVVQKERFKTQSHMFEYIIKRRFWQSLLSRYPVEVAEIILNKLDQKVQTLLRQQQRQTSRLKRNQAQKYFLEIIIDQELRLLDSGQDTSLLPLTPPPPPPPRTNHQIPQELFFQFQF